MFAKTIIDSDAFLDMPLSTQALYFHLSMRADDDGFVNNPKKLTRMIGCGEDDFKLLIAKRFLLLFESGVVVIKHWLIHNTIRKDRKTPTNYQDEYSQLEKKENKSYKKVDSTNVYERLDVTPQPTDNQLTTSWQPDDNQVATNCPHSVVEISVVEDSVVETITVEQDVGSSSGPSKNTLQDVFLFYQNNFGLMSPYLQDDLTHWSNDLSPELVIDAMKRAIEGQKNYNYAKGILKRWLVAGIKTMEQVEASEMQFERNKQQQKTTAKPKYQKQKYEKPVPDWMNRKPTEPMIQSSPQLVPKEELEANAARLKSMLAGGLFHDQESN